jgi:hypothetical protein
MVRVWDIITGTCKWVLVGHTQKGLYHREYVYDSWSKQKLQFTAWSLILPAVKHVPDQWMVRCGFGT